MRRSTERGGVDAPVGDNSGGSSQSDRIVAEIIGNTASFSFNGKGLEMPATPSYEWNFGDSSEISTISNPTHIYANTGTYTVAVTVTGQTSEGKEIIHKIDREIRITDISTEASNSYLYAEKSKNNPLQYSFYTPMVFSGVSSDDITYNWQPDNTVVEEDGTTKSNVYDHTYTKYGKQYTAQVIAKTGTGLESKASVNINIPNPEIDLICTTQGLTVTCYPEITLDGEKVDIPMDFEWNCGDDNYTKTSGTEPKTCKYKEEDNKEQTITVTGESDNIEGSITGEETVYISSILNVGQVKCSLGDQSDHLKWNCNINTTVSKEGETGTLEYRWHFGEKDGTWTNWESAQPGDYQKSHVYSKYRNDNSPEYDVQVEVRYKADAGTVAAQTAETANTNEYSEQGASSTKIRIDAPVVTIKNEPASNNNFERTFTAVFDYMPKGNVKYIWNFGDGSTKEGDKNISHTYSSNGKYHVSVSVESDETQKVFPTGFIKTATLDLNINESLNVPSGDNAIIKTQDKDNPLKWTFKIENVSSSTGNIVYQWKKDNVNLEGENKQELEVEFEKFGKSYSISVDVSIEGTDIKETVSTIVTIDRPVVEIIVPSTIVTEKDAVFTSTVKYEKFNLDVKSMLENTKYRWNVDNDPKTISEDKVTKNWRQANNGKKANLTVTASNVEGEMKAQERTFNVLPAQEFGSVEMICDNNGLSNYDTIRWECTGTALDEKGEPMKVDAGRYRYEWWVDPAVSDTAETKKITNNGEKAILILEWPEDNKANKTATKKYTIKVNVFDTINETRVVNAQEYPVTVERNITYTGRVRNSDGKGENIKNIINISGLQGPEGATYKWVYKLQTSHGTQQVNVDNTNITGREITEINLESQVNQIGFVGKITGNPFNGGNGIGLYIPKGDKLSRDMRLYGVADDNQFFGPSITWCSGSSIMHATPYENEANTQNTGMQWGQDSRGSKKNSNFIYLWQKQNGNITTTSKVSKDSGTFAKITVLNSNAKSLDSAGLFVRNNLKTIRNTIEISTDGNVSVGEGLAFYFDKNYGQKERGTLDVKLEVKDTSNTGSGSWHVYGKCPTSYKTLY